MSLEFVSTMSLEFIVNYVLDWFKTVMEKLLGPWGITKGWE
jgi:hypothetical protein